MLRYLRIFLMGIFPYLIIRFLGVKGTCGFGPNCIDYRINWYFSIALLIVTIILYIYLYKKDIRGNANYILDILYFFGLITNTLLLLLSSTVLLFFYIIISAILTFFIVNIRLIIRIATR